MRDVHGIDRATHLLSGATAVALSLLFITIYGLTGWLTSVRTDVGTWWFGWERGLPFVPWLIVPYMSLDMFFVAAPFLCNRRSELTALALRLTMAILVAGAIFLAMPLQFAFPRPVPTGRTMGFFELLYGFDRPYNLFPSLHVAILMILSGTYHRHTRGAVRWLVHGWFALIAVSTVLTYQHHVIDVAGGFGLAVLCYYVLPERIAPRPVAFNAPIGMRYGIASILLLAAGTYLRPWGLPLLWPALSAAIVAGAYFGLYSDITRKRDGRVQLAARIALAPWLIAQYASMIYYRRDAEAWSAVAPNVWIGRRLQDREAIAAVQHGVRAVLDLTGEFSEAPAFHALPYLNLPILDLTAPTRDELLAAVEFINANHHRGAVYVHCKIGYSRSAAVAGAWLIDVGFAATAEEAVARLRSVRPSLVVRPEAFLALQDFQRRHRRVKTAAVSLREVRA